MVLSYFILSALKFFNNSVGRQSAKLRINRTKA